MNQKLIPVYRWEIYFMTLFVMLTMMVAPIAFILNHFGLLLITEMLIITIFYPITRRAIYIWNKGERFI